MAFHVGEGRGRYFSKLSDIQYLSKHLRAPISSSGAPPGEIWVGSSPAGASPAPLGQHLPSLHPGVGWNSQAAAQGTTPRMHRPTAVQTQQQPRLNGSSRAHTPTRGTFLEHPLRQSRRLRHWVPQDTHHVMPPTTLEDRPRIMGAWLCSGHRCEDVRGAWRKGWCCEHP